MRATLAALALAAGFSVGFSGALEFAPANTPSS